MYLKKSSFLLLTIILVSLTSPTFAMITSEEQTEYYPTSGQVRRQQTGNETTEYYENGNIKSIEGPESTQHFDENGNLTDSTPSSSPVASSSVNPEGMPVYFPEETEYYPSGKVKKEWTRIDQTTQYYENGKVKSIEGPESTQHFDENGNLIPPTSADIS